MIASALIRLSGLRPDQALRAFADARPPGVYKDQYIRELFKYYHVHR